MLQLNKKLQSYRPLALSNVTILFLLLLIYHIISYQPCGYCERLMYGVFFFLEVAVGCQKIEKEQSFNAGCFSKSFASEETLFLVVPTTYQ